MMYEDIRYEEPFLKDVIFRLDYGNRLDAFNQSLPPKLASTALKHFPISEPQKGQAQQFTVSPGAIQAKTEEMTNWIYHGKTREKTLNVTSDSLVITNRKYQKFEGFREDTDTITAVLFESQKDLVIARLGLRYINILDVPGNNPLDWSDYVDEKMLGIINTHKNQGHLSRVFHIVEFNYGDLYAKFQFGIPNPDYPALIKRKQFILDIDAYVQGALTKEDVLESTYTAHEKIQELFESSIHDSTRQLMKLIRS